MILLDLKDSRPIYEQVVELLKASGKVVVKDGGVMPNPTVEKLAEGAGLLGKIR